MSGNAFVNALSKDYPVLFVNIGWAVHYNGSDMVIGNHGYIKKHPGKTVGESHAFAPDHRRLFQCGIGRGEVPTGPVHVVFVSKRRKGLKGVGIYAAANLEKTKPHWAVARTRHAFRIPLQMRPDVPEWPGHHGMRRWARRDVRRGVQHHRLLLLFRKIVRAISTSAGLPGIKAAYTDDDSGSEGQLTKVMVRHRKRESKYRSIKINEALDRNQGRLVCEVRGCGFDFHAKYGELGLEFAEVHHKKPLGDAPKKGRKTKLADLAVVCANCHRMIHRFGQCRPLDDLIP